ncbi:hypothetical protein M430DRAFT_40378 [Amorphotheca resinae ATCC 22711]|uniref:Uncharacterized protein n=1 Tax=Amorphotheca resinae ATCC 22711 TaxID=857342 RepID=A0A2T3B8L6_AMORE|nr:hypothetical protein M430DRAFT_40378 [Amorphotheca resinae ATCC 22711]PSS23181.1 hypothetical protein M430DRAFT_40378 [Amorphotheca resinae ATCC 22711]
MRYYTTTILALGFFTFQTVTSFAIPAKRPLVGLEPPFEGLGPVKLPHNPPIRALEPVQERTYEDKPGSGIPSVQYIRNEKTDSLTRMTKNQGTEKATTEESQTQETSTPDQTHKRSDTKDEEWQASRFPDLAHEKRGIGDKITAWLAKEFHFHRV